MKNGFRVSPQLTKKDGQQHLQSEQDQIKAELSNIQMASRISQMMVGQLMENVKSLGSDLNAVTAQMMELEYKLGAVQKHFNLDNKTISNIANEQRLLDFNHAAVKKDKEDNLLVADQVGADSTVIITSVATDADGNDRGIFRSRIKLSECGVPALIEALQGKSVGDKVDAKLNGVDHAVELLAICDPSPEAVEAAPSLEVVQ